VNFWLGYLSHDWSGLPIAALVGLLGYWLLRVAKQRAARAWAAAGHAVLGIALVLSVGAVYHLFYVAQVRSAHPPPGRMIEVGGFRMHVLAEGDAHGRPPVVWMPGAHSGSYALHHLHAAWRKEGRSILIDRPGAGWSDAGPMPRTTPREVEEVVLALANAGETGPFIFAGHSFGGLLVANIARRYPDLTAAVVLIDATPPDAINLSPPNPFIEDMFREATFGAVLRAFGIHTQTIESFNRQQQPPEFERVIKIVERELGEAGRVMRRVEDSPRAFAAARSSFEELRRGGLGYDETVYDRDLEGQRVYLLAPPRMAEFAMMEKEMVKQDGPAGKAQREALRLKSFYEATRERYMHTSSKAVRVYTRDGLGHNFPYEDPPVVIDTIRRVLSDIETAQAAAPAAQ
jgi:pimeloyl-ACP methyl ester carboxylesterase